MSPRARISPDAVIAGPVVIGPGCLLDAGAHVGPHVTLAKNVIISGGSSVTHSLILSSTYVGAGLELRDAIVSGNAVQHVKQGVRNYLAEDDELLSDLRQRSKATSWTAKFTAAAALALLTPVTALAYAARRLRGQSQLWTRQPVIVARNGPARRCARALRLTSSNLPWWQRVAALSGPLLDVLAGYRTWLGVRPRRSNEWYALHPDWQSQLERAPIGVLHAASWSDDPGLTIESAAAADLYWLAQSDPLARLQMAITSIRCATSDDIVVA